MTYIPFVQFSDDGQPMVPLTVGADGKLYGVATNGGVYGYGSVFVIDPSSGTPSITTVYSFQNRADGGHPRCRLLLENDGSFSGTTTTGLSGLGRIFNITPAGTLTTIATLPPSAGSTPTSLIRGSDGNLYGTAMSGGASGWGTVFKVTPAGAVTALASFVQDNGAQPVGGLVEAPDGSFYGTTSTGGGNGAAGTIFRITPAGALTVIYAFDGSTGFFPVDLMLASDGNFYGTTKYGPGWPAAGGSVFRLTPAGEVSTLFTFAAGALPDSGPIEGQDGVLYGTITSGGSGLGSVYALTRSGTLVSEAAFDGTNGSLPVGGLVQTTDGTIYGTTSRGNPVSASNEGTIFRVDFGAAPAITMLAAFGSRAGAYGPVAFIRGADGAFYGLTQNFAGTGYGTVFKLTGSASPPVSPVLTTLAVLTSAEGTEPSALIQASDGSLYGATAHGGPQGGGTIFKVTQSGVLTTIVAFRDSDAVVGSSPRGGLLQGRDGNLYGTTYEGGAFGVGTLFKITLDTATPTLTTVVVFAGANGSHPRGMLVELADGRLAGTTEYGGAFDLGTAFIASPVGFLTQSVPFSGSNGARPATGVICGSDGKLYGTTPAGGNSGFGTIFRLASSGGSLDALAAFDGAHAERPASALTEGSPGQFFGTTDGPDINARLVYGVTAAGLMLGIVRAPGGASTIGLGPIVAVGSTDLYGILQGGDLGGGTVYRLASPTPVAYDLGTSAAPVIMARNGATTARVQTNVESDARVYRIVTLPLKGTVAIGNDGTFTYTPAGGAVGPDQFTFAVTTAFGTSNAATAFLRIDDVLPTMSVIPTQIINENGTTGPIAFTVDDPDDPETAGNRWTVIAMSSNGALLRSLVVGGTGRSRTLTLTPEPYQSGAVVVSVAFRSSPAASTMQQFWLIVRSVPLPPVVLTPPRSQAALAGDVVTFTAGGYGDPAPTVQWQQSRDQGTTWNDVAGATAWIFRTGVTLSDHGKLLRAVFTNASGTATSGAAMLTVRRPSRADFDRDGIDDAIIWRASTGTWYWTNSTSALDPSVGVASSFKFGSAALGDVPLVGDTNGDGKSETVVWRASTGEWFFSPRLQWGNAALGDVPLLADIDGDGKADPIIWRASTGTWMWLTSSSKYSIAAAGARQWGDVSQGDVPLVGDVDGDGKCDLIVWRASTGTWYWLTSSSGYAYNEGGVRQWGSQAYGDVPLLGDFDGDGKADLTVWRATTGTWFWLSSRSKYGYQDFGQKQWGSGSEGDVPILLDFDGDGAADLVVWRPATGTWYWLRSSASYDYQAARQVQWGNQSLGDRPVR